MPEITEARKEAWDRVFLTASEGTNPVNSLISDFSLQNCETIHFCCASHTVCVPLLWQLWQLNIKPLAGPKYHDVDEFMYQSDKLEYAAVTNDPKVLGA